MNSSPIIPSKPFFFLGKYCKLPFHSLTLLTSWYSTQRFNLERRGTTSVSWVLTTHKSGDACGVWTQSHCASKSEYSFYTARCTLTLTTSFIKKKNGVVLDPTFTLKTPSFYSNISLTHINSLDNNISAPINSWIPEPHQFASTLLYYCYSPFSLRWNRLFPLISIKWRRNQFAFSSPELQVLYQIHNRYQIYHS